MAGDIKTNYKKVSDESFVQENWNREGNKILKDNNDFTKLLKEVEQKMNELNSDEYHSNPTISRQMEEMINTTREYLDQTKPGVESMISQITEKTRSFNSNFDERYEVRDNDNVQSNLIVQDLAQNDEILQQRRKELEDIHAVSKKIKSTTDTMAQKLNEQGAILDDIEANVQETKVNTEKAKKEISDADKMSQGNRKRLCCLIFIGIVAVGGVSAIILSLINI